jgi:hypothetical protein
MSMADLHDIAGKLHELQEASRNMIEAPKVRLLADVVLRMVHELASVEERLKAVEKSQS